MNHKRWIAALGACALTLGLAPVPAQAAGLSLQTKYLYSGASHTKYTNDTLYAAPVVANLDNTGGYEIVSVSGAITATDAATGATLWKVNSGKDRSAAYEPESYGNVAAAWCDPVVRDIDSDGWQEIVSVHSNQISVLDPTGYFKPGFPLSVPVNGPLRSLAVEDFNGDGTCEIIVAAAVGEEASVYAYDCHGNLLPGWPQLSSANANLAESAGIYANNISTGDINGDGRPEIIVPTDNRCIQAYQIDGSLIQADPATLGGKYWGAVRAYVNPADEQSAAQNIYWDTDEEHSAEGHSLCLEFGHAGSAVTDLDGDGKNEVVAIGIVMDVRDISNAYWNQSQCMTPIILNGDRTRYTNPARGYDWTTPPVIDSPRLQTSTDSVASLVLPEPAIGALDGDGIQEIVYNAYDGKVYCYSLDKQLKSYTLPNTWGDYAENPTAPVVKDLDGDGRMEIIFASWTDRRSATTTDASTENTGVNGAIYIPDSNFQPPSRPQLPTVYPGYEGNPQTNGVKAAPTVEDIDADGQYEVVVNTTHRAVCAFDVAGSTTQTVTPPDTPFADLVNHWSKDYVMTCVDQGILSGTSATTFAPNDTTTRAMVASILYRIAGSPAVDADNPYTDVDPDQWYADGAIWAAQNNLVIGGSSGTFGPNDAISRQEIAYMLYMAKGAPASPSGDLSAFGDAASAAGWAQDALRYCVGAGVLHGSDGNLNPAAAATRGELATMLVQYQGW